MFFSLFFMSFQLISTTWEVAAITNRRPSISTPEYSGNGRHFRHIPAGPSSVQLGDWETGLREAIHQALLREGYWEPHLRERLAIAQLIGRRDQATPFGDVAVIARGQLYNIQAGNFMLLQDSYQNDCDDCYNPRRCDRHDCQPYSPHNHEILVALWTVKRLRHRDVNGIRFEIEYIVSPINSSNNRIIMRRNRFNYAIPGHVFVIRNGRTNKKHSVTFNSKIPQNNLREEIALGVDSDAHKKILYNNSDFLTSIPVHYLPPESGNKEAILYNKLLEVLSSKTTTTQKQDVSSTYPFNKFLETTKALSETKEQQSTTAMVSPTFPSTTTMKTIITYFMPIGDEILMPQTDSMTNTMSSTGALTTSTSTTTTTIQPSTPPKKYSSKPTTETFIKTSARQTTKTTKSTTTMPKRITTTKNKQPSAPKTTLLSTSQKTTGRTTTKKIKLTTPSKPTYKTKPSSSKTTPYSVTTTESTTKLKTTTSKPTFKPPPKSTMRYSPTTTKTRPTSSNRPTNKISFSSTKTYSVATTKLKTSTSTRPAYKPSSTSTTPYSVINKPPPVTSPFTLLTTTITKSNTVAPTTTETINSISELPPSEKAMKATIMTMIPTNASLLTTTYNQMSDETPKVEHTSTVFTETRPFTYPPTTTTELPSEEVVTHEMSTLRPTEPMTVHTEANTEITSNTRIIQTTNFDMDKSKSTFTTTETTETSPMTSTEYSNTYFDSTSLPKETILSTMKSIMHTDSTTETPFVLSTTTTEAPTTNLLTTNEISSTNMLTTPETPATTISMGNILTTPETPATTISMGNILTTPETPATTISMGNILTTPETPATTISMGNILTTPETPATTISMGNILTTLETPATSIPTRTETTRKISSVSSTNKTATTPSDFLTEIEPYEGPLYVESVKNDYSLDDIFGTTAATSKMVSTSTSTYTESDISQQLFGKIIPKNSKVIYSNFYEASTDKNGKNNKENEFSTSQSYETSISLELNKRNQSKFIGSAMSTPNVSTTATKKFSKNRIFNINRKIANLKKSTMKNKSSNIDKNENITKYASNEVKEVVNVSILPLEANISTQPIETTTKSVIINETDIKTSTKALVLEMPANMSDFVVYKAEYPSEQTKQNQTANNKDVLDDLALRLVNHARSLQYLTKSNNTLKQPKYRRKPFIPRSKRPVRKRKNEGDRKST